MARIGTSHFAQGFFCVVPRPFPSRFPPNFFSLILLAVLAFPFVDCLLCETISWASHRVIEFFKWTLVAPLLALLTGQGTPSPTVDSSSQPDATFRHSTELRKRIASDLRPLKVPARHSEWPSVAPFFLRSGKTR